MSLRLRDYQITHHQKLPARYGTFIRGPIPFGWIVDAENLGGSALAIGLSLWLMKSIRGSGSDFTASLQELATPYKLSRQSARRALSKLCQAGLISLHSLPGRKQRIQILVERYRK